MIGLEKIPFLNFHSTNFPGTECPMTPLIGSRLCISLPPPPTTDNRNSAQALAGHNSEYKEEHDIYMISQIWSVRVAGRLSTFTEDSCLFFWVLDCGKLRAGRGGGFMNIS